MSTTKIVIENISLSGIDLSNRKGQSRAPIYNGLAMLEVGQSFFLPCSDFTNRQYAQIRTSQISGGLGIKAVMRDDTKDGIQGYRFFRIE